MSEDRQIQQAVAAFDAANAEDPNREKVNGQLQPHELIDARRVAGWVGKLKPDASAALRLAGRCQHIRRWEVPRNQYPMNRAGYLKWRQDLKKFHADVATKILRKIGCEEPLIQAVRNLNLKKGLSRKEGDVQVLEDALCLTFLEFEFPSFLKRIPEERMIGILQKTWNKMSPAGRQRALSLPFEKTAKRLFHKALPSKQSAGAVNLNS